MFARSMSRRKALGRLALAGALLLGAACAPVAGPGGAPPLEAGAPVPVALLVPAGSASASDNQVAQSLENAARLAIADLDGVAVDLRVYPTAGSATQAATAARTAVDEGAAVILGPLYA
jgi:protein-disulfide isomerase